MIPRRRQEDAQLQLVEVIAVAIIIFTAIALNSVFRLPTSPSTFQQSELAGVASDTLRVLANQPVTSGADCNEPAGQCPFTNELERMLSLAIGFVGANTSPNTETSDRQPLQDFLSQALPDTVQYVVQYSNSVNATQVVPQGRAPPLLDVSVSHFLLAPNWTQYSDSAAASPLLRIGENTNFGSPTTIRDPLNRIQDEFGNAHTTKFATAVPDDAPLGTYEACYGGTCHPFSVAAPRVLGVGSLILQGDRDNASNLRELGDWTAIAAYDDQGAPGFQRTDPVYLDVDASNTVTVGDVRLVAVANCRGSLECGPGTFAKTGDTDLATVLAGLPGLIEAVRSTDEGHVYLALAAGGIVTPDDRRLSRAGVFRTGDLVAAADTDDGDSFAATHGGAKLWYADTNGNAALDAAESVYLDLDGTGLGAGDVHLTPTGAATARGYYDVRLVVWFGV